MFGLSLTQSVFLIVSVTCFSVCAFVLAFRFENAMTIRNIKTSITSLKQTDSLHSHKKFEKRALEQMKRSSYSKTNSQFLFRVATRIEKLFPKKKEIELAGLKDSINGFGLALTRIQFAIFGGGLLSLVGCVFSMELMLAGLVCGLIFGFTYPSTFLKKKAEERSLELEKHLPEMLEILSIAMRSGLSFDRALEIYSENFQTSLSREFSNAQKLWMSGIMSRDCALREITKGYDSMIFSRTIEALIRNLKLGTSVASSLLSSSKEARANYQSRREEAVRKAPIKMMIPTGTLILPAMLLLIMGPVMLELAGGGA